MQQFQLENFQQTATTIINFLTSIFRQQHKNHAAIAVSGGIDSALSLTLLTQALGAAQITPIFLPYQDQSTADAKTICEFNQIPTENWQEVNIAPMAAAFVESLQITTQVDKGTKQVGGNNLDAVRLGNVMARCRMITIYDLAKKLDALVVGTENKSEKYLGYFTRFGDEASDIEPIAHLYKTQVRQLATQLALPEFFISKAPSAGLWAEQTDEAELGFSYADADQVLYYLIDEQLKEVEIISKLAGQVEAEIVSKIIKRVAATAFKQQVPYHL